MAHKQDSTSGSDLSTYGATWFWLTTGQVCHGDWQSWCEGWWSHPAMLQQTVKSEIYPKSCRACSRTYAQAAQRATPRPLGFGFFFFVSCGAGVCLSRRAQRADLYKTSTRYGAKGRIMMANKRIYPKFFLGLYMSLLWITRSQIWNIFFHFTN